MPGLFDRLQSEIDRRDDVPGFSPADLLTLTDDLRRVIQALMRRGDASAAELAEHVDLSADEVAKVLDALVEKGMATPTVGPADAPRWRAQLGRRRGRAVPAGIWARLAERTDAAEDAPEDPPAPSEAGPEPENTGRD